jgi:hypothetical protein
MKLAFRVGRYMSRSLWDTARRPPPSAIVITVKKVAIPDLWLVAVISMHHTMQDIPTGAKMS